MNIKLRIFIAEAYSSSSLDSCYSSLMEKYFFASDNTAAAHPEILSSLIKANSIANCKSYGSDLFTEELSSYVCSEFGHNSTFALTFNGTGANVSALSHLLRPWESVICASDSHLATDECGALERFSGAKLTTINNNAGKILPENLANLLNRQSDFHTNRLKILSISQQSEWGLIYKPDEILTLASFCKKNGLLLHIDGARLANAAAFLGLSLGEASLNLGVDVLSLGGTKNGLLYGEMVIFSNKSLAADFSYSQKQSLQLSSKQRFISAQFISYFKNSLWRENASHANRMAKELSEVLLKIPGSSLCHPVEGNGIFIQMPEHVASKLANICYFYPWGTKEGVFRFMTSWATSSREVISFRNDLEKII